MTAAIVLAGGASRRFGSDKLAAEIGGRPLLHRALEAVGAVADTIVVVVAPGGPEPAPPPSVASRVIVAHDEVAFRGPLAALVVGLASLSEHGAGLRDHDAALVVGGDMPHLVPAVLRLLVEALSADPSLGTAVLEAHPWCAFPMAVRPAVAAPAARSLLAADRRALRGLLVVSPSVSVPAVEWRALDPDGCSVLDVDTRADLARG